MREKKVKNKSISYAVFIAFFFIFALTHNSLAQTINNRHPEVIKACVFPLYPLNFVNQDGQAEGLFPDVLREAFKNSEYKLEFVYGNWAECLEKLERGEIDIMTSIAKTPTRKKIFAFSDYPITEIWGQVFIRETEHIHSIKDLEGKKIGIMAQDVSGENFIKTISGIGLKCELIEYPSHADIFEAIQNAELNAGIAPQLFGLNNCSKYDIIPSFIQFAPEPLYFATKLGKNEHLLKIINSSISHLGDNKESFLHKRTRFWLQKTTFEEVIPKWVWVASLIFLALIVFFLVSNWLLKKMVKKQTKELRVKEKQYRELVESANIIIVTVNEKGIIQFINEFGLKIFGYSKDELFGKSVIQTIVPAKDRNGYDLEAQIKKILKKPESFPVYENENLCKDGRSLYIQWFNRAVYDDDGNFKELLTVGIDITRRKELENRLFENQKLEAMGTLAGGVAHDFNNILSIIFGYIELAKTNLEDPKETNSNLDEILNAAKRARDLVKHILTFSSKSEAQKQTLKISLIAKEVMKMLRSTIPTTIEIKQNIVSDSLIFADPTQIHQILMNLCTNAAHSMDNNPGILEISIKDISINSDELHLLAPDQDYPPGKFIQIEVSDTGSGISSEVINKIFEPYFTTKEQGKGTGLGLAVVHGIVRDHKGFIKVYSIPGKGTTFHVYFPIVNGGWKIQETQEIIPSQKGNRERILVVDDEKQIVEILSSILIKNGYEVFGFSSPKTALESFKSNPESFDLVISDMTMPLMNGLVLINELHKIKADLPIIICSGFNEFLKNENFEELGISAYLQKPIEVRKLLHSIREALNTSDKKGSSLPKSLN